MDTPLEYCDPRVNLDEIDSYDYVIKLSSSDESPEYALPDKQKYPINTKASINSSIDYFNKYANEFMPSEALEFAHNVKRAASENEVDISDTAIEKFASLNTKAFNEEFSLHLKGRKRFLKEADYKVYGEIEKYASESEATKVAQLLERADAKLGLDEHWGRGISNPAFAVFENSLTKEASAGPTVEDLRGLDVSALTGIVGTEVVGELRGEEGPVIFESLPRPIKREITQLMKG